MASQEEVTQLLLEWSNGDKAALEELMAIVYEELHQLADSYMRRERPDHTLQATALVNEAYLRLIDSKNISWRSRAQFFAVAAHLMRNILIDHARNHQSAKRGGGICKLTLDPALKLPDEQDLDLIALDDALAGLAKIDPQ